MTAKAVVEIEMIDSKAQNTLAGLNEKLQRLRDRIDDVEVGSEAFKKLAAQIQKTSSTVKTLEKEMEGLEPQQKAEAFLKMGEGVMGGFVAAQGALAMVGVESENLEKIQTRVQGAIAIAMGVRMMSEAALQATTAKRIVVEKLAIAQTKIGTAVNKAAAVAANLYSGALKLIGVSANVSANGMKFLKVAIASTGIGLFVVAIGAIVAYWDDIKAATTGVSKDMRDQLASATATKDAALANMEATEGTTNQLKLAGKSQREILDLKIKDVEAAITASEVEQQRQRDTANAQIAAAKRNEDIATGIIAFLTLPITSTLALIDGIAAGLAFLGVIDEGTNLAEGFSRGIANFIGFDAEDTKAEMDEIDAEMTSGINKLKEKSAGLKLQVRALDEQGTTKPTTTTTDPEPETEDDGEIDRLNEFLQEKARLEQEYFDSLLSEEERLKNAVEDKYFEKIELAKQYGLDTTDLEKARQAEIDAIDEEMSQKAIERTNAELQAKKDARAAFVQAVGDSVGQISGLLAEGSRGAKAAALAEIAINTGLGFIQGLDIAQKSAKAAGPGAALAFPIFYATQIAAVLGAVKKAKAAIGAGGGGETAPVVPAQAAPTRSGNFTLNARETPEIVSKTFVVADEMTNQQSQLADIRRRATI